MISKMTIKCLCGREIILEVVGGQYQNTYHSDCVCGCKWALEEQSEVMKEISEE